MTKDKTDIFNAVATPTAEQWRQLYFHAVTGNDAVLTPYTMRPDQIPGSKAEAERRQKEDDFRNFIRVAVAATQERIARFHVEMRELDERRVKLLERVDEELRLTREKLQRLRDAAPEIEFPDGTRRKVFRDFDQVRDETGALVRPDIIKAEAVSNNPRNWLETMQEEKTEQRLLEQRPRIEKLDSEMQTMLRKADNAEKSDKDLDEFKAGIARKMAEEERLLNQPRDFQRLPREKTLRTDVEAARDFSGVAIGAPTPGTGRPNADDLRPQGPTVSGPAPM